MCRCLESSSLKMMSGFYKASIFFSCSSLYFHVGRKWFIVCSLLSSLEEDMGNFDQKSCCVRGQL